MTERFDRERFEAADEAAKTLRLVATLPAPEGLKDRVHARLRHKMAEMREPRAGFWAFWTPVRRLQFAGAAVIALAVAGSTWTMHLNSTRGNAAAHGAMPAETPAAAPALPVGQGGFGSAGAERVPPTLKPIKVPPAARKKPSAGHAKAASKTSATPPVAPATGTEPNP